MNQILEIQSSPHIRGTASVDKIMRNVVFALCPTIAFSLYAFGLAALLILITAWLACALTEYWACRLSHQASTLGDWSVTITGLLYALILPPGMPLWMVFLGGAISVALGKSLFGGLGSNPFNPALVGRAFLQAAFPVAMTTYPPAFGVERFTSVPASLIALPFMRPSYDITTGATPLAAMKFQTLPTDTFDLFMGFTGGSIGETCSVLILAGGIYLIARRMMNWRIPVGIFVAVAVISGIFHHLRPEEYPSPEFMLFSGGLMLGAMFMATDMVASPLGHLACFVYGLVIGAFVVVIRFWGGMPEGVMYAILLGNALSPHIDRLIQPRGYGASVHRSRL
ncbi:MAG: RnfABCDGE type electron transport complex subunit D [Gammaproteobacteria bacterium]